jgi:hypothetical protein
LYVSRQNARSANPVIAPIAIVNGIEELLPGFVLAGDAFCSLPYFSDNVGYGMVKFFIRGFRIVNSRFGADHAQLVLHGPAQDAENQRHQDDETHRISPDRQRPEVL